MQLLGAKYDTKVDPNSVRRPDLAGISCETLEKFDLSTLRRFGGHSRHSFGTSDKRGVPVA